MSHCSSAMSFDMLDQSEASSECSESWEPLEKSPVPSENAESCSSVQSFDMLDDADVYSSEGEESDDSFWERELREMGSKTPTPQGDVEFSDNSKDCRMKAMKATLKELDEQEIAEISQLDSLKAELAEQESEMKERTAHRNAQIKDLNDEKEMLEEKKKELELKLKMTPNTREVFDEIQEGIKTDKTKETGNKRIGVMQEMANNFVEEMEEFLKHLEENRRRIEENPELGPPTGSFRFAPYPEMPVGLIRRLYGL